MLIQQLQALGVRMLVIDELQRLSKLGPYEQAVIMDALRYISSQLRISLAGFGSNEAKGLIEGDLHLKERFEVVALPGWTRKDGYVRVAMFVLAEPPDPSRVDVGPLGAGWLRDLYAHSRPREWEDRVKHAIPDPLLLFATQLPREAILALDQRSLAWPADLRRRWTYAAAAGAIGGYVS